MSASGAAGPAVTALVSSPVGVLELTARPDGLRSIGFVADDSVAGESEFGATPRTGIEASRVPLPLQPIHSWLQRYFAGERVTPSDLRMEISIEATEFRRAVWAQLVTIPYGRTCSYASLARALGRPAAMRAVGQAVHHNPLPILWPCHRVVGSDGRLTGYAGGLRRKEQLLALEQGGRLFAADERRGVRPT